VALIVQMLDARALGVVTMIDLVGLTWQDNSRLRSETSPK
jgi:hypothetical protein